MNARIPILIAGVLMHVNASAADMTNEMGRLFFTPSQRAALDNARKMDIRTAVGDEDNNAGLPQTIHVNGLLRRSDGRTTIWINNRELDDEQATNAGVAARGDRVRVTMPDSGRIVNLKVGQSINIVNGDIQEGYSLPASAPAPTTPASPETPATQNAGSPTSLPQSAGKAE